MKGDNYQMHQHVFFFRVGDQIFRVRSGVCVKFVCTGFCLLEKAKPVG